MDSLHSASSSIQRKPLPSNSPLFSPVSIDPHPSQSGTGGRNSVSSEDTGDPNFKRKAPKVDIYPSSKPYQVLKRWKWEIVELLVSAALLAAIFILLSKFNGQNVPSWGLSINLSTIAALLATIFRATTVTILSQIISQAKWSWYSGRRARPLQHFQDFDEGSRGMLGAALLLPKVLRHDLVPAVAALVIIVSLAVGSFVQQAIKTKDCPHHMEGAVASLPYAHYVPRQAIDYEEGQVMLFGSNALDLKNAIYVSLTAPGGAENQIDPVCPTGNCTFPGGDPVDNSTFDNSDGSSSTFSTVGLCRSCIDVSSLASGSSLDEGFVYNYELPNRMNVTYESYSNAFLQSATYPNFSWVGDLMTPEFAAHSRWALANVTVLTVSHAGCGKLPYTSECPIDSSMLSLNAKKMNGTARGIAVSCAIYPCTRTYAPNITNNKLSEPPVSTALMLPVNDPEQCSDYLESEPLNAATNERCHYAAIQSPCLVNGSVHTAQNTSSYPNYTTLGFLEEDQGGNYTSRNVSAPEQCIYRHNAALGMIMTGLFKESVLQGSCGFDPRSGVSCDSETTDPTGLNSWLVAVYNDGNASVETIDSYFESFTEALTKQYRMTLGSSTFNDSELLTAEDLLPQGEVQGVVWRTSVCTSVQWQWLLLPAILWGITGVLLVWTIARSWKSRRATPVWKSNPLAAILYRERFREDESSSMGHICNDTLPFRDGVRECLGKSCKHGGELMETGEMKDMASRIAVKFEWVEHKGVEHFEAGSSPNRESFGLRSFIRRRRQPANKEAAALVTVSDSLLSDSQARY